MLYIHFWPVLIISLVTVIGKMLSSTLGTLLTGQTIRTSVQVGFSLSQIGEFSFIIAGLGSSLGVTSSFLYPIGVAVCVITTFTTPYLLRFADPLADLLLKKLPAPLLQLTNWYSRWIQEQAANTAQSAAFSRLVFRWLLNGVIVTLIFLFVFDTLPFFIDKTGYPHLLALILTYIIAICLSSPFLWGMSTMFNHFSLIENKKGVLQHARGLISFASRLVTILWLDLLSLRFFNARIALFLTFVSVIGFFVFFYHRLEASYRWFEKSFLFTFESKEVKPQEKAMPLFAPWDAHLVRLLVHPNSAVAGKSLQILKLRSLHGVNIIAIQRDRQTIFAPVATAVLYPADSLLMLGIDDQIETIRPLIEEPSEDIQTEKDLTEYRLKNILVPAFSYLCNKSIRESNLREQYSVIVVGLERANQRQLNPDSWLEIKAEDILWVVGEPALIDELEAKIAEQHLG
jgi:CPA2 family monovalent cation:H+ antiporter-2